MTADPTLLAYAALAYAASGWPVFPCLPDAKAPHGRLVPRGCKDATTDLDKLAGWWRSYPDANVAIATGAPGPDVVDIDTKHGAPGMESLARLRRAGLLAGACRLVATPSGGVHLYYAGTTQTNASLRRHGVDFRSRGGYVIAAPSTVAGVEYQVTDIRPLGPPVDFGRIRRFLDPPTPAPPADVRRGSAAGLARWLAGVPEGGRNNALYWACRRAVEEGHDLAPLVAAAVAAGLPELEAHRTAASARRTGAHS